jgi:hypothetical protein
MVPRACSLRSARSIHGCAHATARKSLRSNEIILSRTLRLQGPTQVSLAQGDDVVATFAADRSDEPFCAAVLPRRTWGDGPVPDAHCPQSARDRGTVDPVPIADQVARSLIPRECLRDLPCNPFRGRICCDVNPDKVSARQPDDDEGVEQVEAKSLEQRTGPRRRCRPCDYSGKCATAGWAV